MYYNLPRTLSRFLRNFSSIPNLNDCLLLRLPSRRLIRISGSTVAEYVQGLITNDITHLIDGSPCMYAMFLNTRGRVLYDTLIYKQEENDSFLIECDISATEDLKRHLNMFKVRRKINIANEDQAVWNISSHDVYNKVISGTATADEASIAAKSMMERLGDVKEVISTVDPRTSSLGLRVLAPPGVDLEQLITVKSSKTDYYSILRYNLGIGEGVQDHPKDNCFPLEANCDYLHGVSFHKGCYIGQELTARTHHTGVVRKRLMPMVFNEDASSLPSDTVVTSELVEKSLGKLRSVFGVHGIGLLRVEEVLKSQQLIAGGKKFKTMRPFWWPNEAPKERMRTP